MNEPIAYLIEWKAHDNLPPEYRRRLQFDDKLDAWMAEAKITPLYRRDPGSAGGSRDGVCQRVSSPDTIKQMPR